MSHDNRLILMDLNRKSDPVAETSVQTDQLKEADNEIQNLPTIIIDFELKNGRRL